MINEREQPGGGGVKRPRGGSQAGRVSWLV